MSEEETTTEEGLPKNIPDNGATLPEWVPPQYQDPANRQELMQKLGITAQEVSVANRPDWLPEQFKTPEALAQSYNELRSKMDGKSQVPERYELDLPEGAELPEEDAAKFKELGFDNETAQKLMSYYYEEIVPGMQEQYRQLQEQTLASAWGMTKEDGTVDGESMKTRIAEVAKWAKANLPDSMVTELGKTAEGMQSLYKMMRQGVKVPGAGQTVEPRSKAELQSLVNDPRYWSDEGFRAKVERQFAQAYQ